MDIPRIGGASKPNDKACQALAKVLTDAKRGEVKLVAIIAVGDSGQPNVVFGGEADLTPSVNLGCDMLKATIMQQIIGGATSGPGVIKPGN